MQGQRRHNYHEKGEGGGEEAKARERRIKGTTYDVTNGSMAAVIHVGCICIRVLLANEKVKSQSGPALEQARRRAAGDENARVGPRRKNLHGKFRAANNWERRRRRPTEDEALGGARR